LNEARAFYAGPKEWILPMPICSLQFENYCNKWKFVLNTCTDRKKEPLDHGSPYNNGTLEYESSMTTDPYFPNLEGNPIETGPYPADLLRIMTILSTSQQGDSDLATTVSWLTDETRGANDL
jgi:hypothetical protein